MKKVVSVGASKEAALYFDYVFPDDLIVTGLAHVKKLNHAAAAVVPLHDPDKTNAVVKSLLPHKQGAEKLVRRYNRLMRATLLIQFLRLDETFGREKLPSLLKELQLEFPLLDIDPNSAPDDLGDLLGYISKDQTQILQSLGFMGSPYWFNEDVWTSKTSAHTPDSIDSFILSLRGMSVIDANRLSWEEILEFRKDESARSSLRRLRTFFEDNFAGKDPDYISDKLLSLEDDYSRTAKLWGFETTQKALSVVFSERSSLVTSASGLAAALAGAPLGVAAAAAAAIPLGRFSLEFSNALIKAAREKTQNPVRFISHLRRLNKGL